MATNRLLLPKTMQDIDGRVERVIRGLGNPEPPLELSQVRELLKLDLAFYTADDPGIAREVISRVISRFRRMDCIRFADNKLTVTDREKLKSWIF